MAHSTIRTVSLTTSIMPALAVALLAAPTAHAGAGDPFAGKTLFVDPDSNAAAQAEEWRSSRPEDAEAMDVIAARPQADWFGDWTPDPQTSVDERVTRIAQAGALPVLVAYDIPYRDCFGHSGGGAPSASAYLEWVRGFARGIGSRRAAVILEPDAVAAADCLWPEARRERFELLRRAVQILENRSRASTYIDAGHSGWQSAEVTARRLRTAGIENARGFSLNVSNFRYTETELSYGVRVGRLLGGKHFVIDTSRNGLGPAPDAEWCNPPGRALGPFPSDATGRRLADAFLWIKRPGESDGPCNGGPEAGVWWPEYALALVRNAGWG
jgi:endoglucanase